MKINWTTACLKGKALQYQMSVENPFLCPLFQDASITLESKVVYIKQYLQSPYQLPEALDWNVFSATEVVRWFSKAKGEWTLKSLSFAFMHFKLRRVLRYMKRCTRNSLEKPINASHVASN